MGSRRSWGISRYHASERDVVITHVDYAFGGPLVIVAHGFFGDATSYAPPEVRRDLDILAAMGCVVIVSDLGGGNTWGLDSVVDPTTGRIAELRAYAAADWGADITRMGLIGDSMGAMNILGYMWRAPSNVQAAVLRLPVVAADLLHDRDPAGLGAGIDAAYGSSANWEADKANRDPLANAEKLAVVAPDIRIYYSANDPTVLPSDITAFVAATGMTSLQTVSLGDVAHDPALVYPAIPARRQATWLLARLNDHDIDQAAARSVEDRWLAFIRDAGSGSPSDPTFNYLGGDVTDAFLPSSGAPLWIGADWLAGTTVQADDTYTADALPQRNGALLENPAGTFDQQLYQTGTSGLWLNSTVQGGLAANTHWWPIAGINDGGTNRTACWFVDSDAPTPYGTLLDSHIVTLNGFGGYASHVATGLGGLTDNFWVDGLLRDTTHTYIYGEQFVPDYDANDGGGQPNYGQGEPRTHYTLKRVARVPNGQLTTVANWTYWNGATWVPGVNNATPMVDTHGVRILGDAGVTKVADSHYVLAAHRLTDIHMAVYRSTAPQGPWRKLARIPVPRLGQPVNGGIQIGQLTKILAPAVAAAPAGYSVALTSRNILAPTDPLSAMNIRRLAPQFTVIPQA